MALQEAAGMVAPQSLHAGAAAQHVQSPFADMTSDEKSVYFPLLRAIMDLARRHDGTFEHLVRQTQWLLKVEGRADHPGLNLTLKAFGRVKKARQASTARRAGPARARRRSRTQ